MKFHRPSFGLAVAEIVLLTCVSEIHGLPLQELTFKDQTSSPSSIKHSSGIFNHLARRALSERDIPYDNHVVTDEDDPEWRDLVASVGSNSDIVSDDDEDWQNLVGGVGGGGRRQQQDAGTNWDEIAELLELGRDMQPAYRSPEAGSDYSDYWDTGKYNYDDADWQSFMQELENNYQDDPPMDENLDLTDYEWDNLIDQYLYSPEAASFDDDTRRQLGRGTTTSQLEEQLARMSADDDDLYE